MATAGVFGGTFAGLMTFVYNEASYGAVLKSLEKD